MTSTTRLLTLSRRLRRPSTQPRPELSAPDAHLSRPENPRFHLPAHLSVR